MEFSIAEIVKAPFEPRLQRSYRCAVSLTSSGFSVKVALSRAIKAYELLIFKIFMSSRAKKVRHRRGFERYKSLFTNKKAPEGTFLRSPLRAIQLRITGLAAILAFGRKNDHPGYPCGKAHWAFVTGVGPFAEIGVGLGEPYRADKQHPTRKAPGGSRNPRSHLESATPSAKHILPQNADHFAEAGKMVLWGTDRA